MAGQRANDLYRAVRKNLQDLKIRFATQTLPVETEVELDTLVDRFETSGPIAPKNVFEMNYSSSAALVSTIVTYLIVLIEFKSSYQIDVQQAAKAIQEASGRPIN